MKSSEQQQSATMSVEEAAKRIGIGRGAAYRAAKRGDLPVIHIGKRIRVVRDRLERMLAGEGGEQTRAGGVSPAAGGE